MFGTFRYLLALMVVFFHLWTGIGGISGPLAVFTFYLLSGYLMTLVLNETYGFSFSGGRKYLFNRLLRVFPPYWVVFAMAYIILLTLPDAAHQVEKGFSLAGDLLTNLKVFGRTVLLIGADMPYTSPIVLPAWSLHVELIFYVLMWGLLSRTRTIAYIWFGVSVAAAGAMWIGGASWEWLFFSKVAGSLPFSAGACLYYLRDRVRVPTQVGLILLLLYFANIFLYPLAGEAFKLPSLYLSVVLAFGVIGWLRQVDPKSVPSWFAQLDKRLGEWSYPIFLVHYNVAALTGAMFPSINDVDAPWLFLASLPLIHIFGIGIHAMVERPVNRLRDRVRKRGQAA
jgi:peptidoglycan/LPS O-acetylase OafA/YrhL